MTRYANLETNSDVTDVLFCIVLGKNKVKDIVKKMNQPQSTISTKLQFLRENKIIIKDKWSFEPNWEQIYKVFYNVLKKNSPIAIKFYVKSYMRSKDSERLKKILVNTDKYFPESRLKEMLESYSELYFKGHSKASFVDIVNSYLVGLVESDKIKDRKLNELRNVLKAVSKEVEFFEIVEK